MEHDSLDKKYYKIKDVAEIVGVPQSTLRFWESEFPELCPMRTGNNTRYYTPEDIEVVRIIHFLVKVKGLKIEAAKSELASNRTNVSKRLKIIEKLTSVRDELEMLLKSLQKRR